VRFVARREGTRQYWAASADAQRLVAERLRANGLSGLVRPRFDSQLAGAFIVDGPGEVPSDRIFVLTETAAYAPRLKDQSASATVFPLVNSPP
jgi:hypothetical protein